METVDSDFHSPQLGALWLEEGEEEGGGCPCTHILDAGEVSSQHACCIAELD